MSEQGWLTVADGAARSLKEGAWRRTHPTPGDWIADQSARAGYSVNAFRRQIRVVEFLRRHISASDWQSLADRGANFGVLEVLCRMADAAPERARQLMPQAISGEMRYRQIREMYASARQVGSGNGKNIYALRSSRFAQRVSAYVRERRDAFTGPSDAGVRVDIKDKIGRFPYARPELIAIGKEHGASRRAFWVDAFVVKLIGQDESRWVAQRTLEQAALLETMFRQVWLIYPRHDAPIPSNDAHLSEICEGLDSLGMDSVGLALINEGSNGEAGHEFLKMPKPNAKPVRYKLLADHLAKCGMAPSMPDSDARE